MFVVECIARNSFGEWGWKDEGNVWCIFMKADDNIISKKVEI